MSNYLAQNNPKRHQNRVTERAGIIDRPESFNFDDVEGKILQVMITA